MPRISTATIEEINARTDIVSLVGEYTRLEKRGGDYWGCCPFHNEKTPSFHVIPDRKMYYCFGCGAGGSIINFFMEMEKVTYAEAITSLAKKNGIEIIYDGSDNSPIPQNNTKDLYKDLYTRVAGSFRYMLTSTKQGEYAKEYLASRGISDEISEQFNIGYAPENRRWLKDFLLKKHYSNDFLNESGLFSKKYPDIAFFSDRLMFPICDRMGNVVAFGGRLLHGDGPKYLNSSDLIQYKKGETLFAFNHAKQAIRTQKAVILCEGYMDVIAYHQAGLTHAVAPLGTALTEEQIKLIHSFADTVYLSFDSDSAGIKATWKAILMTRRAGFSVRVVQLEGGKDPAEILVQLGAEVLTEYVNSAILDSDFLLSTLSKKYDVTTPEGKARASLEFFQYIDVLQSDIQKQSCLDQLSSTYQLNPEAVKADFDNRQSLMKKIEEKKFSPEKSVIKGDIKPNAELRAVLAVISNLSFFPMMRESLSADDFEDSAAQDMFITIEECYREDALSSDSILGHCKNETLKNLIVQSVTSREFSVNSEKTIKDSIRIIKYNSLLKRRNRLLNRIRQASVSARTLDQQQELNSLVTEKMNIDSEIKQIKDANE